MRLLLNELPFFRHRVQMQAQAAANQAGPPAGGGGGASYEMGYMVKKILDEFCTSAEPVIRAVHLKK
jgi:hypothetical protein